MTERVGRSEHADLRARDAIEDVYRSESRRVLATLIRLLGDFDLAEEALHDAFAAALDRWPVEGVPDQPRAWLVSTGRFKAIDKLRRTKRATAALDAFGNQIVAAPFVDPGDIMAVDDDPVADDRLRLIFTCCHPALSPDARLALTLREVCGLETEAIARAFLSSAPTLAQRIVRAKAKIREARIPYQVPGRADLAERLDTVLHVIYLLFNEGYSPATGETATRPDVSAEAIRLGRLLVDLLPEPEAIALLALMLLHDSRRDARVSPDGEVVLLADQDRTKWHRDQIDEGRTLVERALASRRFGPYALQASIAAVHADAHTALETDWRQIVGLYDVLLRVDPSPIVELNRAAAVAMCDGADVALRLVDAILERGGLSDYYLAHSARADLCRRLERYAEAEASYTRALALAKPAPEKRFLERRLADVRERELRAT